MKEHYTTISFWRILRKKLKPFISYVMVLVFISIVVEVKAQKENSSDNNLKKAEVDDITLIKSVAPFPYQWFSSEPKNENSKQLMDKYLLSIFEWDAVLLKEFKTVTGHDNMGYYGDGGNKENSVRPICYAALVNAFLSKVKIAPSNIVIPANKQSRMEEDAIKVLRYLTYAHVTGKGKCENGEKWGNQWQSSMWARSAALAGWILWDRLDQELKIGVARLLEYEANRAIVAEPRSQVISNTGAEENAWDSQSTSLAFNMMPDHPNRSLWDKAAKKFMYNSFSVAADRMDTSVGDDKMMIKEWVTTVNAYPDFSLENHGRVHMGYLKNTLCMMQENILDYKLMGNKVPDAAFHHAPEVLTILKKSMMNDASVLPWGSDDWRIVHCQAIDNLPYTVSNLLNGDKSSAYLESKALDAIRSIQYKNGGYFNYRRDLEWSGLASTRLINSYLLHAIHDGGAPEISEDEYNKQYNNITYLPDAKAIIHRNSIKFASFSWGAYLVALTLNNDGSWQNWPRESSYVGRINGTEAGRKNVIIERIHHEIFKNGFTIKGRFRRNIDGLELIQDVSFSSLGDDITVYTERFTKISGVITSRETGLIGHEFEQYEPDRILYHDNGASVVNVNGGQSFNVSSNWLNIGDKIGYVVCRNGQDNIITYHTAFERDRNCDYINLIGEKDSKWSDDWACVVTFLNQKHTLTADWVDKVDFRVKGDSATCKIGNEKITVNFGDAGGSSIRGKATENAPTGNLQ